MNDGDCKSRDPSRRVSARRDIAQVIALSAESTPLTQGHVTVVKRRQRRGGGHARTNALDKKFNNSFDKTTRKVLLIMLSADYENYIIYYPFYI